MLFWRPLGPRIPESVTGRSLLGISHSRWVLTPQPVKEVLPDHLRPPPALDERGVSDRAVFLCSSSLDPPSNTLKVKLELLTVAQRACKIWLLLASPATLSHPSNCILPSHHPQPHRMKLPSPSACRDLPAPSPPEGRCHPLQAESPDPVVGSRPPPTIPRPQGGAHHTWSARQGGRHSLRILLTLRPE